MNEQPEFEVAIGSHRFDPADEEPEREARDEDAAPTDVGELRAWIVQFERSLEEGDRARLRSQYGLRLATHIPELAYLERLDSDTAEHVRADPLTRACVPYRPEFKLAPSIGIRRGPTALVAILFDDADPARTGAMLEAAGARDLRISDARQIGGQASVRFLLVDPGGLEGVARLEDVQAIEPMGEIRNTNVAAASTIQGGAPDQSPIWDQGLHGEGQVIGIIDDGPFDIDHCFFKDEDKKVGDDHRKILAIHNLLDSPATDHATLVAGCAAGDVAGDDQRGAPGTHPQRGGAWAAKLVSGSYKHVDDVTLGHTMFDELFEVATAGAATRFISAFIVSNSWFSHSCKDGENGDGDNGDEDDEEACPDEDMEPVGYNRYAHDVDAFIWANEDLLVFGGSGNTGQILGPPGTAKNAICVAAAEAHPNHADLSSGVPGPTEDGRRKPELVTVGRAESAVVNTACGIREGRGTSLATAHAAGAAALVRQYFIEGWYPMGEAAAKHERMPSGALIKAVLLNATVPMAGTDFAGEYPTHTEGWGRLQLDRALHFKGGARKLRVWDRRNAEGLENGDTRTHRVEVKGSEEPLKVTLVWTEPPGVVNAADPVVNDLDLRVTSPDDATVYRGNAFLDGESDPTSQFRDSRNNVEMVLVKRPTRGKWTIEVKAIKVAVGDPGQGYALVVTGDISTGCFVGTAVYGDPEHPDVALLREWRDKRLAPGARGRAAMRVLVAAYEHLGPRLARIVGGRAGVTAFLRRFVFAPVVAMLRRHNPEAADPVFRNRRPR